VMSVLSWKPHAAKDNKFELIAASACECHICLSDFAVADVLSSNDEISLLLNHPSTNSEGSKLAFINRWKFESVPNELSMRFSDGALVIMPLIAYRDHSLYYFQDTADNRFLLSMSDESKKIEGLVMYDGRKYELHSIDNDDDDDEDEELEYILVSKNWISDAVDWCGIFAVNTQPTQLDEFMDNDITSDDDDEDEDVVTTTTAEDAQHILLWVGASKLYENHVGLNGLLLNKNVAEDETLTTTMFHTQPLCANIASAYDGNVYCVAPNADTDWQSFASLSFYSYNAVSAAWTELDDDDGALDLVDASTAIAKAMCVATDNEIYLFAVNIADAALAIYSFTTAWRLHHYAPLIAGDLRNAEIRCVLIGDVLYFSVNEVGATGAYSVHSYSNAESMFSVFDSHAKAELPIYTHCLTQFDGALLSFYVDYGHNLYAYFGDRRYSLEFNLAQNVDTNQFDCVATASGNVISWRYGNDAYYLQVSPTDFQEIVAFYRLPWKMPSSMETGLNVFQVIAMQRMHSYQSVSVYYADDVVANYLTDARSIAMDVANVVDLSNILYGVNNKYAHMMRLEQVLLYEDDGGDIDAFTSVESESDINILLVDSMSDGQEAGYSECDTDEQQSFAVVQYSAF